jgi:hypothetical protein
LLYLYTAAIPACTGIRDRKWRKRQELALLLSITFAMLPVIFFCPRVFNLFDLCREGDKGVLK